MQNKGKWRGAYPDVEVKVFIGYRFDIEADCWYRCDNLSDLCAAVSHLHKIVCPWGS